MAVVATVALVTTGCQWTMARFDSGNTADNPGETTLSGSDIGGLGVEWSAALGAGVTSTSEPVLAGNTVYVGVGRANATGTLSAYSADASVGCSGSPLSCTPLWTASGGAFGQPLVNGAFVYVDRGGTLEAYDASGQTNCSGSPVACQPVWSGTGGGAQPRVAGSRLYVLNGAGEIDAYATSTSTSSCTGSPLVCAPVTRYHVTPACPADVYFAPGVPEDLYTCRVRTFAVDGSQLLMGVEVDGEIFSPTMGEIGTGSGGLVASFDLASPSAPTWTSWSLGGTGGVPPVDGLVALGDTYMTGDTGDTLGDFASSLFAVTSAGQLDWSAPRSYFGLAATADTLFGAEGSSVDAYATTGGCGQSCTPVRRYQDAASSAISTSPAVAADVLYVGAGGGIDAYSATGALNCSAGTPVTCTPLRTVALGGAASALSVSDGLVFVTTGDGRLIVLGLT